jgi:enediyne biosynthesis protein E4
MPSSQTGIRFTNQLAPARSLTNQIYLNGSGVAAGDVDGDGWCDLYFCGLDNQNQLYRNLGNWTFESITSRAGGVGCAGQASTGVALADLDGDGDLDLLVNGIASGTRLFLNDGRARFIETTESAGLGGRSGSMSLAVADVNGDGWLDVYVVNYRSSTFRDEPEKRFRVNTRGGQYELATVDGRPVTEPDLAGRFAVDAVSGVLEQGEPDVLYINQGGARFRRVEWADGTFTDRNGKPVAVPYDWGLSAMFRDVNDDGAPDLYVCNDFQSPDRFWMNSGQGKFREAPAGALRQTSLFSMGVDFADLDGDGHEEIFVADMLSRKHRRRQTQLMEGAAMVVRDTKFEARPQVSRNTLFWNRGDGSYAEIAQLSRLEATEWSWCPVFVDVDLDGRRDLLVTAGHERDAQHIDVAREMEQARKERLPWREQMELRRKFPRLESPILAFRNRGELAFAEVTSEWGFTTAQVSQGIALADLDNDGDLDLAANCLNAPALLYRNETTVPRIAVRLRGRNPNDFGIGARIAVQVEGLPRQSEQVISGGRYLSSDEPLKVFAARIGETAAIEVIWPDQRRSRITNAHLNTLYEISQERAVAVEVAAPTKLSPMFTDVSTQLSHAHKDERFDDFQRQLLLPRKFSELGPGVSWFDLDGDGWEDLLVGSGRAGRLAYFRNNRGTLASGTLPPIGGATKRDQAGIVGWTQGTNRTVLMAFSNYEDAQTNGPAVIAHQHHGAALESVLAAQSSSAGALAMADADADGDLDLFVAGRIIPARYPEPASSVYLRNDQGSFQRDDAINKTFASVGLVSAATWSDLNGDGMPELLLAIDGGALRVFSFTHGGFRELTAELGLAGYAGFWQSVTTGDFNNDGRMDIVAGNLGRNSKYQKFLARGYHLYYGDLEKDGRTLILEAYHDDDSGKIVPLMDRDSLASALPDLPQRYATFESFSQAGVAEILGERAEEAKELRITVSESMLFLNEGGRFRAVTLPWAAQVAPVFGLAVGDVDADGDEDLFMAQNLFSVGKGTSRYDAGEGLLLLGDGRGVLSPVPANVSGIKMEGEGRGAAFCDFDHDGRLDLVAAQNSGATKLYRNAAGRAGLRVLMRGDAFNSSGIGSQVRLRYKDGTFGPAHELRAGEGYWSQAAATMVLGKAREATGIEVLWPGGRREIFPVSNGEAEFVLQKRN